MMNYNQIVTKLKTTAQSHINVVTADAGVLESLNWGEIKYPLVMMVMQPGSFEINKIVYNVSMVVADVVDQLLQQIPKQSAMFEIGRDVITYLINDSTTLDYDLVEESVVFTPFVDNFPDLCAGIQFDFQITTIYKKSCNLPFNNGI
jgi:hypothetical protein